MSTETEPMRAPTSVPRSFKERNKLQKSSNVHRFKRNTQDSLTDFKLLKRLRIYEENNNTSTKEGAQERTRLVNAKEGTKEY